MTRSPGLVASCCDFDDQPDNIDLDHARLWHVGNGEIVRCAVKEVIAWGPAFGLHERGNKLTDVATRCYIALERLF